LYAPCPSQRDIGGKGLGKKRGKIVRRSIVQLSRTLSAITAGSESEEKKKSKEEEDDSIFCRRAHGREGKRTEKEKRVALTIILATMAGRKRSGRNDPLLGGG